MHARTTVQLREAIRRPFVESGRKVTGVHDSVCLQIAVWQQHLICVVREVVLLPANSKCVPHEWKLVFLPELYRSEPVETPGRMRRLARARRHRIRMKNGENVEFLTKWNGCCLPKTHSFTLSINWSMRSEIGRASCRERV